MPEDEITYDPYIQEHEAQQDEEACDPYHDEMAGVTLGTSYDPMQQEMDALGAESDHDPYIDEMMEPQPKP